MKLKLCYPIDRHASPFVHQFFGTPITEELRQLYTKLGLSGHNGVDFVAVDGALVRAAHDGEVVYTGEDGSSGLIAVIRTTEQFDYKDGQSFYKTVYGHLKQGTFKVRPGDVVKSGQPIALADNTGASTGSHLHFGLKPVYPGENQWQWDNIEQNNGYRGAVDPASYWTGDFGDVVWNLTQQVSILQAIISLYQQLFVWKK